MKLPSQPKVTVGRKSRRAHDERFRSHVSAPDLSRSVDVASNQGRLVACGVVLNEEAWGHAKRTAWLKSGAEVVEIEWNVMGAPRPAAATLRRGPVPRRVTP
jgi:hypothetical protein